MVECVGEVLRIRRIAVTEAGIIRRHEMKPPRKPREEWLVHARRRGKTVQQQKSWRLRAASLAIEDREAVDLDAAVGNGRRAVGAAVG
jgi:hypothetical protein